MSCLYLNTIEHESKDILNTILNINSKYHFKRSDLML